MPTCWLFIVGSSETHSSSTKGLELARKLGDRSATADALLLLARTALHYADHARAAALSEESLALSRTQRDKVAAVRAMVSLADVTVQQGMPERADALYREGLPAKRSGAEVH